MSNDIKISRELAERLERALNQVGVQDHLCDYTLVSDVKKELRALLAAPVAESQPVAWVVEDRSNGLLADDHKGIDWFAGKLMNIPIGTKLYMSQEANISAKPSEPLPMTDGMNRLIEAFRLGEFRLEGGSPTVEAMSCASYDNNPVAVQDHDFDSYASGYQAAMYEEAKSLLGLIACLDKVKELNQ